MQDKMIGAEGERPLDLAAKSLHRLAKKEFVRTRQIHEVVRVDHQRLQVVARPKEVHLIALRLAQFVRSPLARTGRKDLKCIAA